MGCFYGVCAVTQRPIQNGDDVYCLFIKNINLDNKIDITPSYTGSNWKISEFPIKAKYHDNGFIAKIHPDYEKNFNFHWINLVHFFPLNFQSVVVGWKLKPSQKICTHMLSLVITTIRFRQTVTGSWWQSVAIELN